MQDEQIEIAHFLRRLTPFAGLPPEQAQAVVEQVAATTDVAYFKAGTDIVLFGAPARYWHVVRSGVVEVFRRAQNKEPVRTLLVIDPSHAQIYRDILGN